MRPTRWWSAFSELRSTPSTLRQFTSAAGSASIVRSPTTGGPRRSSQGHNSAATGTVIRPDTVRAYAAEAVFDRIDVLPIEHDFWRDYRLLP